MANMFSNNWWNQESNPGSSFGAGSSGMSRLGNIGAGIGGLASGLKGLFGGHGPNPGFEANKIINQIPGQTKGYFDPYINNGQNALNERMKRYGQDPTEIYNKLGAGYQQSPGYKFQMDQAMQAAQNAAGSGGMLGTPYNQQVAQEGAQGIASKDYENYLNHVLGIYGDQNTGLSDITHGGQTASSDFAKLLAEALGASANYQYAGQEGENKAHGNDWESIFKALPFLFGG